MLWGISSEERDKLNDLMVRIVENARDAERDFCEGKLLYNAVLRDFRVREVFEKQC